MPESYHCLCSNFILATASPLVTRRENSALDRAYIFSLSNNPSDKKPRAVLEGVEKATEPSIIQREDGFEKRWVVSCERCELPVGYYLDWLQFQDAQVEAKKSEGVRADVLYVLPGALVSTADMQEGKKPPVKELKLQVAVG